MNISETSIVNFETNQTSFGSCVNGRINVCHRGNASEIAFMSAQKTKDIQQTTCFLGTTDAASKTHMETFWESVYPKAVTQPFGKHFIRV